MLRLWLFLCLAVPRPWDEVYHEGRGGAPDLWKKRRMRDSGMTRSGVESTISPSVSSTKVFTSVKNSLTAVRGRDEASESLAVLSKMRLSLWTTWRKSLRR